MSEQYMACFVGGNGFEVYSFEVYGFKIESFAHLNEYT
jgi:hypothetical protein